MSPVIRTLAIAVVIVIGNVGCFSVQHQLPENAYFGKLPRGAADPGAPFETHAFKNWALAGLLPYSAWSTSALLADQPAVANAGSLQIREIETVFAPFDVAISIVPGAFYGYYVWATRTIRVSGAAKPEADPR